MFWFLFVIVILIGCAAAWLVDFFEQMKNSEYEIIRVLYWAFVLVFWITILIWIWD